MKKNHYTSAGHISIKDRASHSTAKFKAFLATLSKKQKGLFFGGCSAALLIIVACLIAALAPEPAVKVTAVEAVTADIQQTITVSGTVVSSSKSSFKAADGVSVKEVNVALGDVVAEGQVLASFDVAPLAGKLEEKEQAYTQSKQTYEESLKQAELAEKELPDVNARIAELEAAGVGTSTESKSGDASIDSVLSNFSLDSLMEMFSGIGNTLTKGFDFSSMLGSGYSDEETELIELKARKVVLESQVSNTMKSVYQSLVDSTLKAYEDYKAAYEALTAGWKASEAGVVTSMNLKAGETFSVADAQQDFDINSVLSSLKSGVNVDSLLSTVSASDLADGIVIDNYSGFSIDFDINQYDIPKVSMGQTATVSVVNSATKYTGSVSYISPVMSNGESLSSFDLSSITSSLTGGSAAGLDAAVKVDNPDKSMIIGMTVDMELNTSFVQGAVAVPIEAIYIEGSDMYVFKIVNNKAVKQLLEVGISSNTMYQVVSGCSVGEKLVKNPMSSLEDGTRVKIKTGDSK